MYKLEKELYFPRLNRIGETTFKSWGETQKTTNIYKLNWHWKETILRERHVKWLKQNHPHLDIPFIDDLSEPYNQWMKKMQYALPVKYLHEIRRCAQMANVEYNIFRPFDTSISDMCLDPGIKFVYVAFRLVADCAYDPKTEYFYRGEDKAFLTNALLFKFWINQTGRGMVWQYAEMDKLSNRIEQMTNSSLKEKMCEFLCVIEDQIEYVIKKYNVISADQGTEENEEEAKPKNIKK